MKAVFSRKTRSGGSGGRIPGRSATPAAAPAPEPLALPAPPEAALQIEWWPIARPQPYPANARTLSDRATDVLAASIKEFGWRQPIVCDARDVIVVGHTRLLAAQKLGLATVPVHPALGLSEAQCKAYRLMDNRTADETSWNLDLLEAEMAQLRDAGDVALDLTGFEAAQIEEMLKPPPATDDDAVPDAPAVAVSAPGDLWLLGSHRLLCGDSTDAQACARLMDGAKADMVFTDPPYGMFLDADFSTIKGLLKSIGRKNRTRGKKYDNVIGDHDDFTPRLIETVFESFGYCKEIFLWGADYYADLLPKRNDGSWLVWDKRKGTQAEAIGSEFELCWSKARHKRRTLRHDWFGFLSSANSEEARNRMHPTQKPTSLIADILEQWGESGTIVADLYGGSGSTLIACEKLTRRARLMELDPRYVDVIVARWQQYTGREATLEATGATFAAVQATRAAQTGDAAA